MSELLGFSDLQQLWESIAGCPHGSGPTALNAQALREKRPYPDIDHSSCTRCPYNVLHVGQALAGCFSSCSSQTLSEFGKLLQSRFPDYRTRFENWAEARGWKSGPARGDEAPQALIMCREVLVALHAHPEWIANKSWRSSVRRYLDEVIALCIASERLHRDIVIPT